jgi:Arc/MetJ-type ribon-helix-helix transcriptional regulator
MLYVNRMAVKRSTTVRLDEEDVAALERARADGLSSSDLIRRGLRVVAAKYYRGKRRPPSTGLFVSSDRHLGEEDALFEELEP